MIQKTRIQRKSREGVTLLFTISMIVLFLLMGTTFVVVANDYFKTSKRRIIANTNKVNSVALLDSAFYQLFRGPALSDSSSPLRGHSILEDQYGYGMTARLTNVAPGPTNAFKTLVFQNANDVTLPPSLAMVRGDGAAEFSWANYVDGLFNGRVVSITNGAGQGYSGRIISHFLQNTGTAGSPDFSLRVLVPTGRARLNWFGAGSIAAQAANPAFNYGDGVQVLFNGRDFAGTGAGGVTGTPEFDENPRSASPLLNALALEPNRIGDSRATLTDNSSGYLPSDNATNEPYDIPDVQNMFLSGQLNGNNFIPSFHRDRLYQSQFTNGDSPNEIRRFSFRPVFVDNAGETAIGSTSQSQDKFGSFTGTGSLQGAVNGTSGLDVDADADGTDDAVWIDIGLPIQTDSQGRQFRPLVAYLVKDMDGRLNLNAHGSYADQQLGGGFRLGAGYGPAEISLRGVVGTGGDYLNLLNARSGFDTTPPRPGNPLLPLGIQQNLFGYVDTTANSGNLFSTGADIFARCVLGPNPRFYGNDGLPEYQVAGSLTGSAQISAYSADLGLGGGIGDSLFQSFELERLLRSNDPDSRLIQSRLHELGDLETNVDAITTDSAEIAMPPFSVLSNLLTACSDRLVALEHITRGYLSNDVVMGGRFDLNQPLGNGFDDDGDGVVDDPQELGTVAQPSPRQDGIPFNLDAASSSRKAKQLYTLALLITGDTPPAYMNGGSVTITPIQYRQMVAQWAANVVDFADPDSVHTVFEYDINPFNDTYVDGDPFTNDGGGDRGFVYGVERPELLITETLATHERRTVDSATDNNGQGDMASGDVDWDSSHLPIASTFIELYHPWTQSVLTQANPEGFQVLPAELASFGNLDGQNRASGVDLGKTGPGNSPVWRIGIRRPDDASLVRAVFFTDPSSLPVEAQTPSAFYPSTAPATISPGQFCVLGSSGNAANGTTTFGRLNSGIPDVDNTQSITLNSDSVVVSDGTTSLTTDNVVTALIDRALNDPNPRSFSLSEPDESYSDTLDRIIVNVGGIIRTDEDDGVLITPPLSRPFDTLANDRDRDAIWTNGVTEQFRVIHLQRLANPDLAYDDETNPYITIDTAEVDLLAFNGLNNDPSNDGAGFNETYNNPRETTGPRRTRRGPTAVYDEPTAFETIERGDAVFAAIEDRLVAAGGDAAMARTQAITEARRTFFRTEATRDIDTTAMPTLTGHNFGFSLLPSAIPGEQVQTLGRHNDTIGWDSDNSGDGDGLSDSVDPLGWLVFHNRPYANAMELFHVPLGSNETFLDRFNFSRAVENVDRLDNNSTADEIFTYYMSDDKFGHLMGFGGTSAVAGGAGETNGGGAVMPPRRRTATFANRFDLMFDFVDVPSRFLGSKTFLPTNVPANPASGLLFDLNAPLNVIPNFREPGRVNVNTIYETQVFDAVNGLFGALGFPQFQNARNTPDAASGSDFAGLFTAASAGQYVNSNPRVGGDSGVLRRQNTGVLMMQSNSPNVNIGSWYDNDFRQRMSAMATTRSSVFSIWITIGYFEVDEFGRLGDEIGSDEGEVRRNRAFFMVDRSIPVASEPGKNHNVDDAVLVRSIIE